MPPSAEIKTAYDEGETMPVELHDGGKILLRKLDPDYDPTDRGAAFSKIIGSKDSDEILTGLLYIDETGEDMATQNNLEARPLNQVPYKELNPGPKALKELQKAFR